MDGIIIRKANEDDIEGILRLLIQVNQVHADGRPDLFKSGGIKYTGKALEEKLKRENEIVFVAADKEGEEVLGYIFGIEENTQDTKSTYPKKTFYIDDFCVDSESRGTGVGTRLYSYVKKYAKQQGFDRITLHVWECNPKAKLFYERMGMVPMYTAMEDNLC